MPKQSLSQLSLTAPFTQGSLVLLCQINWKVQSAAENPPPTAEQYPHTAGAIHISPEKCPTPPDRKASAHPKKCPLLYPPPPKIARNVTRCPHKPCLHPRGRWHGIAVTEGACEIMEEYLAISREKTQNFAHPLSQLR